MKVLGVEHIGIAVKDLDESIMTFKQALGLDSVARAKVEASGVEVAVIPCGDTKIELVKPLGPDSPVSRFIEKGGSPIHHICFK
jgi:methylmalonyl-CoA/ethylmalonyl-CoA epimerase